MPITPKHMANQSPVVRGIDVGYGHVKISLGRSRNNAIDASSFPSQAPMANQVDLHAEFLMRPDTFRVPVNGRVFEVGKQVGISMESNQELEQLDDQVLGNHHLYRHHSTCTEEVDHCRNVQPYPVE